MIVDYELRITDCELRISSFNLYEGVLSYLLFIVLCNINLFRKPGVDPGFFYGINFGILPMPNYVNIGKLVATFGVKGEMILKHNLGKKTALKGLSVFFIEELPGSFLPYFLQQLKIKSASELFVEIEGLDSKEKASKYLQQQVWVNEIDFKKFAAANAPISLLGFLAVDNGKALGEVLEVIEQPHQVMCRIQFGEHDDILIPINEQSLLKIDRKNKKLMLDLPEGLIEAQI